MANDDARIERMCEQIDRACERTKAWLRRDVPEWPGHPMNATRSVSSHFGPTILSESDCVMQFARHLKKEGVPWEDMHFELGLAQWLFKRPKSKTPGWRVDLALIERERLLKAPLPTRRGELRFDAFFEFSLASNYWVEGQGGPAKARTKVKKDIEKVADRYLTKPAFCERGYVIVWEECDHEFPPDYAAQEMARYPNLRVRFLRGWSGA